MTPFGPTRRVVVLGDSLAVSPSRAESFPSILEARIGRERLPWTVTNAGINGDTTSGGLLRIESLLRDDVGVVILELGANDGLRGVPVATVEQNLAEMIEMVQARGIQVLLCGMETPPTRSIEYTLQFHSIYPRLAQRYRVPLVPFLLQGVALVSGMNGPDGVHPSAAGARRIADTVWPYLEPMLRAGVPLPVMR